MAVDFSSQQQKQQQHHYQVHSFLWIRSLAGRKKKHFVRVLFIFFKPLSCSLRKIRMKFIFDFCNGKHYYRLFPRIWGDCNSPYEYKKNSFNGKTHSREDDPWSDDRGREKGWIRFIENTAFNQFHRNKTFLFYALRQNHLQEKRELNC